MTRWPGKPRTRKPGGVGDDEFDAAMEELGVRPVEDLGPETVPLPPPTPVPARGRGPARPATPTRVSDLVPKVEADPAVADVLRRVRSVSARPGRRFAPDAPVLDLHGLAIADALAETRRFLQLHRAYRGDLRLITGRGKHADGEAAVRDAVEAWLGRATNVATLRRGEPHEGGAGIVIVRLRRSP